MAGKVLAIDPGPAESAYVFGNPLDTSNPIEGGEKCDNEELIKSVRAHVFCNAAVVIERFVPYGRPIGESSIQTILFTGRLIEAVEVAHLVPPALIPRRTVSRWICDIVNATDANIRLALVDRYGPGRELAVGTKKKTGPLYGVKADVWLALALAITYAESVSEVHDG